MANAATEPANTPAKDRSIVRRSRTWGNNSATAADTTMTPSIKAATVSGVPTASVISPPGPNGKPTVRVIAHVTSTPRLTTRPTAQTHVEDA